ncbi:hypothetical protein MRB53_039900 [Persea americana]|nr:hypothetical protein MRB53_039900 [Persea americana]
MFLRPWRHPRLRKGHLFDLLGQKYAVSGDLSRPTTRWLYEAVQIQKPTPSLKYSLLAVAFTRIGGPTGDDNAVMHGKKMYTKALGALQYTLWDDDKKWSDEVLLACRLLSIYEMMVGLLRRKSSILGGPEWRVQFEDSFMFSVRQKLFDIGFDLAALSEAFDIATSLSWSEVRARATFDVLLEALNLDQRLLTWHQDFCRQDLGRRYLPTLCFQDLCRSSQGSFPRYQDLGECHNQRSGLSTSDFRIHRRGALRVASQHTSTFYELTAHAIFDLVQDFLTPGAGGIIQSALLGVWCARVVSIGADKDLRNKAANVVRVVAEDKNLSFIRTITDNAANG